VSSGVKAALASGGAAQWGGWVFPGDDLPTRRELLAALLAGAVAPREAMQRVLDVTRPGKADLAAYRALVDDFARTYYAVPPARLLGAVRLVGDRLAQQQSASLAPTVRAQLSRLHAEVDGFVGRLNQDLDQYGQARAAYASAAATAKDTGAVGLWAMAVAQTGTSFAPVPRGEGDILRARALLAQAADMLRVDQHSPSALAWTESHLATRCALTGDHAGFTDHLHRAGEAHHQRDRGRAEGGFYSDSGWFSYLDTPYWLNEHAASGLNKLGMAGAVQALEGVDSDNPRRRCTLDLHLFEGHAREGDLLASAAAGMRALRIARDHGLGQHTQLLRAARTRLPRAPEYADLDAALVGS
jgi:hypothetical protein